MAFVWQFKYYVLILFALGCVSPETITYPALTFEENTTERYSKELNVETVKPALKHLRGRSLCGPHLKYILQWTPARRIPFEYCVGQQGFIGKNCSYVNCYVTADRNYLGDYTKFDVIAFDERVVKYSKSQLPQKRSPHQKYVFSIRESPHYYPVCKDYFDDFFNWTWTFKTNSDSSWGYLVVRDMEGKVLGPNTIMHWIKHEDMLPASDELKSILRGKNKAAAWFVSNCQSRSKREDFVNKLNKELQSKYGLNVDIYGKCGNLNCTNGDVCNEMIKKDYFFYLSFENSFGDDYVTEKLTRALENSALPIVYGGANYSRFMPDGAYLNARELGVEKLAAKMNELMKDFDQYADYFRWTNHYWYHNIDDKVDTDHYCAMCTVLNDESKVKQISVYKYFRTWWNNPNACGRTNILNACGRTTNLIPKWTLTTIAQFALYSTMRAN